MSGGAAVVVAISIVAVIGVVAWFVFGRRHPENADRHDEPDRHGSALIHGDVDDRPAGADAEAMGVAGPGEPVAGASPESERQRRSG